MKVDALFQVRMASTRLPKKMLRKIQGISLLEHVVRRVKAAHLIQRIILATTVDRDDNQIVSLAKRLNIPFFRGSVNNVLERFYQAAKKFGSEVIVRITPDDPFKDPQIIDELVNYFLKYQHRFDYVSNTIKPTYPEGLDIEIFSFEALEKAYQEAKRPSEREHVTPYIWKNPQWFRIKNVTSKQNLSHLRWTIDYDKDLKFAREIYKRLYPKKKLFLLQDILELLKKEPHLLSINQGVAYHEGYLKSLKEDKLTKNYEQ